MAKKKYLEESERKLIESVNNAYIPTDWDEFEKRYHEMERYGEGKPRKVDKEKMEYIEDGLVSRGMEGNQLSSLLSTIVEESGGNPFSVDDSGKFRGLIQFSKKRYSEKDFNRDKKAGWKKAVDNQLDAIIDHLNEYGGDYGFLDGGDGSGYRTGEDAKNAFWGRDSDIENVTRALTYGFVRPSDRSGTTENRTRVARLINEIIQPPVEAPDVLEFDYDGKHYKATKPEEVTPEMRRALMLSKLVGEKNNAELQDSLYTTFNEAYGRAKNKGAGVFMWNGKKYSTKEEGGDINIPNIPPIIESRDATSIGSPGISAVIRNTKPSPSVKENPIIPLIASFLPGIGDIIDVKDMATSISKGDYLTAAITGIGLLPIPFLADATSKGIKYAALKSRNIPEKFSDFFNNEEFDLDSYVRHYYQTDFIERYGDEITKLRKEFDKKLSPEDRKYVEDAIFSNNPGKIFDEFDVDNATNHQKNMLDYGRYLTVKRLYGRILDGDDFYKSNKKITKEGYIELDDGRKITGTYNPYTDELDLYNPKSSVFIHELRHRADIGNIPFVLSNESRGYLRDAYALKPGDPDFLLEEAVASNTELRALLYQRLSRKDEYIPDRKTLDHNINSMSNEDLINAMESIGGYFKDYIINGMGIEGDLTHDKIIEASKTKRGSDWLSKIRKSLVNVPAVAGVALVSKNMFGDDQDYSMKNGGNIWTKENEEDFQKWYAKIAKHKGLNPDPDDENQYYDYRTFWLENPEKAKAMLEDDPEAHFADRYKYPGHPTFSNESMYADEEHPGGRWETVDGVGYYVPSEYTKSYIDRTMEYLAGQNEGVYVDGEYKLIPKMPDGGLSRLAPRDNTSVGHPGSAKVPPITPSDVARNNPVISTIVSFTPIIGEMLDIRDLYTSLKNNDKTGILLALTGLVPIIGGVAGNVIKRNNPFWKERIFSPEEIKRDEELVSKFPDYAHPNSPMGAAVLNHEERLANNAFRKFQNIPASRIGVDPETGNVVYDFNGLDFRFVDISNADELKKISDYTGLTSEELLEYIGNNPFTSFGDHILINRKYIDEAAKKGETNFIFRDGIPHNSPQEEVVRSHEIDHLVGHGVQRESAENSGFSFDWMDDYPELGKEYSDYFRFSDNTEVAARGSQLKDYFGLTNSEQEITPEMLEYAYRHYLDDYGINNDMDLFFKSITDFKKASDWINKYSTAGLGAYWLFDRAESVKDENLQNGGLIKFSKKIDGSSIFERNMVSPWRRITRDMVPAASPSWTNKRKRRFDRKDGGDVSNITPRDKTSVGRPGSADAQPVKPSPAARENPIVPFVASLLPGIGDVVDAHDFIQAAANKDRLGMALAAAGFIPVVGDVLQEAVRLNRARKLAKSVDEGLSIKPTYIIEESDRELLSKMPEYAHPNSPYAEAYDYHVQRLKDKAYEEATGREFASHARNKYGIEETVPGVYDKVFDIGDEAEDLRPVAMDKAELPDYLDYMINPNNISSLVQDLRRESGNSPMMVVGTNHSSIVKDSKSKYYEMISGDLENQAKSHELDHIVKFRSPKKYLEGIRKYDDWFDLDKSGNPSYFENGLELAARGSQIKDYFGLTNSSQKVTADMLKYAARHYTDDVTNNNMVGFFNGIKDWDKAAEWISKYATAFTGATLIPRIMDDAGVDEKKEKEREFVRQFTSGGHSSKYDVLNFDGSLLGKDYKPFSYQGRALKWRSDYIKKVLQDKYGLSERESGGLVDSITPKSLLSDRYYDPNTMSYGIGAWRRRDLFHFLKQYSDGGLADQIDFLAKEYLKEKEISGGFDAQSGVFDRRQWVVKRIGNEEFYTNSPLLKTLPSMSREDVALSLLPPELWPGILKRKEDVTGKSARKHFVNGGETSELQDYIYDRLTKEHGIAPIQAIGIVANLTQESALNYDALGDNGRSYGIQQWQGDRRKNLFEFARKRGRDEPALDDQVDFLVEEYKDNGFLFPTRGENMYKTGRTDKDMFDYFQYSKLDFDNATNIYDSTRAWAQGFGRGNKNFLNMDRRFHIAKTLSTRYNIDAGGQSFYTDMGYKDEWGSPMPEVAVSAEKKAAQDDWMEKYGNKMLASILAGDEEGGGTHVTNNYYVNEEGLSEDEKRNAAEVQKLQQKQQAEQLLASIIDGIKLDIKGVTEVRKQ